MYRKLYVDGCVDIVCNVLNVQSPLTLEQLCQIIQEKLPGSCVPKDKTNERCCVMRLFRGKYHSRKMYV